MQASENDAPLTPLVHLTTNSPSWPAELDTIDQAPLELWGRGRLELLSRGPRVAVVGTRSPTPYGELQATRFAGTLASAGCVVVSGLARGIDARSHEAALQLGGATIAVLGSGVDRPWPAGALAERMTREGLLLSEYSPGTTPRRHHFPLRNRLIAGLCQAVVVIEAAYASGSLITARWAVEQGREVFALPGRVDQPMARGCHRLLREGARLLETPEELLTELGGRREAPESSSGDSTQDPLPALARHLVGETLRVEELAERTQRSLSDVLAELVQLELDTVVARCPGGLWRLTARSAHAGEDCLGGQHHSRDRRTGHNEDEVATPDAAEGGPVGRL